MTDATPDIQDPQAAATLPGNLTAAAVVLLVFGALGGVSTVLALLAFLLAGTRRFVPQDEFGMGQWMTASGQAAWTGLLFVVLLALLGAALTGAHVAAGWAILQRHRWARVLGLVVSGAALVVLVVGLASMLVWATVAMPPGFNDYGRRMGDYYHSVTGAMVALGTIITLGLIAAYGFVLWVLARHGDALDQGPRSRGPSSRSQPQPDAVPGATAMHPDVPPRARPRRPRGDRP